MIEQAIWATLGAHQNAPPFTTHSHQELDHAVSSPKRPLDEILDELHDTLDRSGEIGEEARANLREAADDIRRALADAPEAPVESSLTDRLRATIEDFEESHPRLTAVVGRLADALSDLGI
jgi:hypothetical protein